MMFIFGGIVGFLLWYFREEIYNYYFKPNHHDIAFITLTNSGYLQITKNCLRSIERLKTYPPLHIYAYGSDIAEKLSKYTVTELDDEDLHERQLFRKGRWGSLTATKFSMISENLENFEYVCMTDGDIVFLEEDIFTSLKNMIGDNDLLIMNDTMDDKCTDNLCSGFMFIRSSPVTRLMFDPMHVEKRKNDKGFDDQVYINEIKSTLKFKLLPLHEYPNGRYFYTNCKHISPKLVHFNWTGDKLKTMKNFEMLY